MQNIAENNKLIAEFLEAYKNEDETFEFPQYGTIRPNGDFKTNFNNDQLKFHKDWNWLMEVVDKIESLGYWTEIVNSNLGTQTRQEKIIWCEIIKENHTDLLLDDCFTKIVRSEASTKIQAVYNACVEFVKWYNEQK